MVREQMVNTTVASKKNKLHYIHSGSIVKTTKGDFPGAVGKNLPMWGTRVRSPGLRNQDLMCQGATKS